MLSLAKVGNSLHISYTEEDRFSNFLTRENFEKFNLKATEATSIKKNCISLVKARTDTAQNGLVIVSDPSEIFGCLSEITNGKTIFPIANTSNKDINFKVNQHLAKCDSFELCDSEELLVDDQRIKLKDFHSINNIDTKQKQTIHCSEIHFDENLEPEKKNEVCHLIN